MMSLLLHKSKANLKLTVSVNNKNIIETFLGYNLLISQRVVPNIASFVEQQAMASSCNHLAVKLNNVLIISLLYLRFKAC